MPIVEPFTVAEVKATLGIRNAERDAEIARLIPAARAQIEDMSGHLLARRSHKQYGTAFVGGEGVTINVKPVHELTKVEHLNDAGTIDEVEGGRLVAFGFAPRVFPAVDEVWPTGGLGYAIEVDAGYDADEAPPLLLQAMLLLIGHWFENHEAVAVGTIAAEVPLGVRNMVEGFKDEGFS